VFEIEDVFPTRDEEVKFWNEEYLVEALLPFNGSSWVLAALNYPKHHLPETLAERCPVLENMNRF
jgi:hypothetical protein